MHVKIISPISGERFSYVYGEIVDLPDDHARDWIRAGLAVDAPGEEVAAARLEMLQSDLGSTRAARDGLAVELDETKGKLAAAEAAVIGAKAEADTHRAAATALRADVVTAADALDAIKEKYLRLSGDLTAAYEKRIAAIEAERDDFRSQSATLGEQLAAAQARIAELEAAAPPAPKSRKSAAVSDG